MAPPQESPALAGLRERAEGVARRLSLVNREIRETEDAGGVASDALLARRDEYRRQLDGLKHQIDLEKGLFGQVAASDNSNAFDVPPGQGDPTLETGHYDDGHSFGWNQGGQGGTPADADALTQLDGKVADAKDEYDSAVDHLTHVADLAKINQTTPGQMDEASARMEAARSKLDDLREQRDQMAAQVKSTAGGPTDAGSDLDTGHYDDGHSFGWKKADSPTPNTWTNLSAGTELSPEPDASPKDTTTGFNWKVAVGGVLAIALIAVVAIVALGGGSSSKKEAAAAVASTDASSTANDGAASVPAAAGPVRYTSNCNGACFMTVDSASCDRTFHFDITLLGDVAQFEGTTGVISMVGPGAQPTYEAPVQGGKVVLDVVVTGASYGGDPVRACGVQNSTVQWSGLLTSVDGQPTITPNPPAAN